jgi:polynucleotide 5'-hydroxyl-kinase GRC3/NOL9
MVIESDDNEDRQLVPSDDPLDDSDIEILPGPPPLLFKNRAWSPSKPLDDLADDLTSSALSGEKGTIVVSEQGESICLLGMCRLTLLKGTISLNGVPLQPSLNPHRIFSLAHLLLLSLRVIRGPKVLSISLTFIAISIQHPPYYSFKS